MKSKNVIYSFILAGLVITTLSSESVLAIPLVSVEPTSQSVVADGTIPVRIAVSGVADLYAYQFDLTFDPTVLSAVSITEGDFLAPGGSTLFVPGTIDNGAGSIRFTADTLIGSVPGMSGTGTLANVQFQAVAAGTSPLDLANVLLLDSSLGDISATTAGRSVEVTPGAIPEPQTLLLVGFGLLGLAAVRGWGKQPGRMGSHAAHQST